MCKNSIWDLIYSTINRRDERDVQTAFFFFFMFIKQSLCFACYHEQRLFYTKNHFQTKKDFAKFTSSHQGAQTGFLTGGGGGGGLVRK